MADLNNLPTIPLSAEAQSPLVEYGPDVLDALTVQRFADLVQTGIVAFDEDNESIQQRMVAAGDQLDALFVLFLAQPSTNRFVVDHRAFALTRAVRELIERAKPTATPERVFDDQPRAIGNLEVYLADAREQWQRAAIRAKLSDAQLEILFDEAFLLTAEFVASLIGSTTAQLATWRAANTGPRFVKLASQKQSIRYPAAALLAWLEGI